MLAVKVSHDDFESFEEVFEDPDWPDVRICYEQSDVCGAVYKWYCGTVYKCVSNFIGGDRRA